MLPSPLVLPYLTNKNAGYPVRFTFQIHKLSISGKVCPVQYLGYTYPKKYIVVYLKLKFNYV